MIKHRILSISLAILLTCTATVYASTSQTNNDPSYQSTLSQVKIPQTLATIPKPKSLSTKSWWYRRHLRFNQDVKNMPDAQIVFIGDSITHSWERGGKQVWAKYYTKRKAINLGISADKTQDVIWRLQNGNLEHIKPKLFVIMIGTNNTGHNLEKPQNIAYGIAAILKELRAKQPQAKILLLAIFPRGNTSLDPKDARKARQFLNNEKTNRIIQTYADLKNIFYLNINHRFLDAHGKLPRKMMPDLLHPQALGYAAWADAIEPYVVKFLGEKSNAKPLLDAHFTQWTHADGSPVQSDWTFQNGTLLHTGHGKDILSKKQYQNFVLSFDFKLDPRSNSGVKYKVTKYLDKTSKKQGKKAKYLGIEYQVLDDKSEGLNANSIRQASAAYDIFDTNQLKQLKPVGQYNHARIVVNKNKIEHWLNGARVVSYNINSGRFDQHIAKSKFKKIRGFALNDAGKILIQSHGGKVWYRNVILQEIK